MTRAILIAALCMQGCAFIGTAASIKCPVNYEDNRYRGTGVDITRYIVPARMSKSPMGVPIGPGVDGARVDSAFASVAKCLGVHRRIVSQERSSPHEPHTHRTVAGRDSPANLMGRCATGPTSGLRPSSLRQTCIRFGGKQSAC